MEGDVVFLVFFQIDINMLQRDILNVSIVFKFKAVRKVISRHNAQFTMKPCMRL
jgi:hypothetical protein